MRRLKASAVLIIGDGIAGFQARAETSEKLS